MARPLPPLCQLRGRADPPSVRHQGRAPGEGERPHEEHERSSGHASTGTLSCLALSRHSTRSAQQERRRSGGEPPRRCGVVASGRQRHRRAPIAHAVTPAVRVAATSDSLCRPIVRARTALGVQTGAWLLSTQPVNRASARRGPPLPRFHKPAGGATLPARRKLKNRRPPEQLNWELQI